MKKMHFVWLFVAFTIFASLPAVAGDVVIGEDPTADELINALKPVKKRKMKFRSIRPVQGRKATAKKETKPQKRSVNLTINFEFNSATLTAPSKKALKTLGTALNSSQLEDFSFKVVGHTDSKGSADYNLELSNRRAASVKDFLVNECSVEGERLESLGKGEKEPIDKNNPESAANRRVEVINIGA